MNYEKILLEMLDRIKTLEEKVELLETFKAGFEEDLNAKDEEYDDVSAGQLSKANDPSGRNQCRQEIMNILKEQYGFSVRKANRSEGSGLVATKNGKSYGIKVSYSRSYFEYVNEDLQCCGWHAVTKADLENINISFYVFVVEGEDDEYHYFIFTREGLYADCFSKSDLTKKKVHLYFRVTRDGRAYEAREGDTDMSEHYNNWSIITA